VLDHATKTLLVVLGVVAASMAATLPAAGQTAAPTPYPEEFNTGFMRECVPGAGEVLCQCALDYLAEHIPIEEMLTSPPDMEYMTEVMADCVSRHGTADMPSQQAPPARLAAPPSPPAAEAVSPPQLSHRPATLEDAATLLRIVLATANADLLTDIVDPYSGLTAVHLLDDQATPPVTVGPNQPLPPAVANMLQPVPEELARRPDALVVRPDQARIDFVGQSGDWGVRFYFSYATAGMALARIERWDRSP
jgi:hypothetical protein